MLRPDRLDTVEEVSEPASDAITNDSLPHDGYRWPSQVLEIVLRILFMSIFVTISLVRIPQLLRLILWTKNFPLRH